MRKTGKFLRTEESIKPVSPTSWLGALTTFFYTEDPHKPKALSSAAKANFTIVAVL